MTTVDAFGFDESFFRLFGVAEVVAQIGEQFVRARVSERLASDFNDEAIQAGGD